MGKRNHPSFARRMAAVQYLLVDAFCLLITTTSSFIFLHYILSLCLLYLRKSMWFANEISKKFTYYTRALAFILPKNFPPCYFFHVPSTKILWSRLPDEYDVKERDGKRGIER